MTGAQFLKRAFPLLIEATGDPTAPIKLQEAHKFANAVGAMLASKADRAKTEAYSEALMANWPGEEIDKVSWQPEFVMSLASMFCGALEAYTRKVADDPSMEG